MNKVQLTKEERELEARIFSENWLSEEKGKIKNYQRAAKHYMKKDARLNIRVSSADLKLIKEKSDEEGLPYQSLISSLIHRYAHNQLVDRGQIKTIMREIGS